MSFREDPGAHDTAPEPTVPPTADPPMRPGTGAPTAPAAGGSPPAGTPGRSERSTGGRNMLPERERRRFGFERLLVRLVATCGIVGIGVALGAILRSSNVQGWIIGLVVAIVSVVLSAVLWSSRQV